MPPIPPDQVSPYGSSIPTPRKMIGGSYDPIRQRYGGDRHTRTIKRWIARGEFPPPDLTINNRPYWFETTLDEFDRQRVAASLSQPRVAAQSPPPPRASNSTRRPALNAKRTARAWRKRRTEASSTA